MKKILFITPGCFDKGGISRYTRYQIQALRDLYPEKNIRVLSLMGPDKDSFEGSIEVHWHGNGTSFFDKIRLAIQTVKQFLFWRPTICHVCHINFCPLIVKLSQTFKAKSILNVYGLEVWSGLSKSRVEGIKNINHVISDCHYTANYIETVNLRPKGSTTVIWDCVDLNKFKPQPNQWDEVRKKYKLPDRKEHFIILTLGRLAREASHKGYERLLQVMQLVSKKHEHARLVIAGKGNMVDALKTKANELGIADKVSFTGMVHDDDMAALYSYAHVFSLVSDRGKGRGEGIPLTPLEAMACGTPIIVGNHDGSQEAVVDEKNGWVIDPFDLKKHAQIINSIVEDVASLDLKKNNAFLVSQQMFSYTMFLEKHRSFYMTIS